MKNLITGVVAGLIVFAWMMFSWMALPFHAKLVNTFQNEAIVMQALKTGAPESGIYAYPGMKDGAEKAKTGPMIFTSIYRGGKQMPVCMAKAVGIQSLIGFLLTLLLVRAKLPGFKEKMGFILLAVSFAGAVALLPNWNWWSFPLAFVALDFADLLIGWGLAGLWITRRV